MIIRNIFSQMESKYFTICICKNVCTEACYNVKKRQMLHDFFKFWNLKIVLTPSPSHQIIQLKPLIRFRH